MKFVRIYWAYHWSKSKVHSRDLGPQCRRRELITFPSSAKFQVGKEVHYPSTSSLVTLWCSPFPQLPSRCWGTLMYLIVTLWCPFSDTKNFLPEISFLSHFLSLLWSTSRPSFTFTNHWLRGRHCAKWFLHIILFNSHNYLRRKILSPHYVK